MGKCAVRGCRREEFDNVLASGAWGTVVVIPLCSPHYREEQASEDGFVTDKRANTELPSKLAPVAPKTKDGK